MDFAFLHGGGQGGWIWEETIAAIRQQAGNGVRCVAFDLPGCGTRRDSDVTGLSVRDVAAFFVADLAASGLKDVILVGHSNAGTILPLVAEMRPDLVRRYVYVACVAPRPGESVVEMIDRHSEPDGSFRASSLERLREMFCNDMAPAEADAFMAKLHKDRWPTAEALREHDWHYDPLQDKPATYIVTLRDQALPPDLQAICARRLHVDRQISIDAGHQVMNTNPHALAKILLAEARL